MDNVALAKEAFAHSSKSSSRRKTLDYLPLFDAVTHDVSFKYAGGKGTPLSEELHGKAALIHFFNSTVTEIAQDGKVEGPLEFIGYGDKVIMLGTESYNVTRGGRIVSSVRDREFAIVLRFRDSLIAHILEIKDLSEITHAHRSN